jgi:hypothetical protein
MQQAHRGVVRKNVSKTDAFTLADSNFIKPLLLWDENSRPFGE